MSHHLLNFTTVDSTSCSASCLRWIKRLSSSFVSSVVVAILLLAVGVSSAFGHCKALFVVNQSQVLTKPAQQQRLEVILQKSPLFRGKTLAESLSEMVKLPSPQLDRLLENNSDLAGYYSSADSRFLLFRDTTGNIYGAEIPNSSSRTLEIIEPQWLPSYFDEMFEQTFRGISRTNHYSVLKVLDLGEQGISLASLGNREDSHLIVTPVQVEKLLQGTPLRTGENPLFDDWLKSSRFEQGRPVVIWGDPFLQAHTAKRANVLSLLSGLQDAYPGSRIVVDDPVAEIGAAVSAITRMSARTGRDRPSSANLVAVFDSSESVQHFDLGNDAYAKKLQAAGIEVIRHTAGHRYQGRRGLGVMVLTAHSDEKLAAFVDALCAGGYFEKNLVLLNSCGTANTKSIIAKINRDCGAMGTLGLLDQPNVNQLKALVQTLTSTLSAADSKQPLYDLYNKALGAAKIRGLWQTSWDGRH